MLLRADDICGEAKPRSMDIVPWTCTLLYTRQSECAPHGRLVTFVEDRTGYDAWYAIDLSPMREELGWWPHLTLEEGLKQTVDWYRENEPWWRALQNRQGVGQRLGQIA